MRKAGILLLTGIMFVMGGCVDIPKYDNAPRIEFVGIDKFDSEDRLGNPIKLVRITLSFEDGDGDLGEDIQNEDRKKLLEENGGWYNYNVQTFRYVNEKWEFHDIPVLRYLAFPVLKPDGTKGPIRGKLDYDLEFSMGPGYKETPVKFQIKIRDRELRESNIIETDSIVVPIYDEF